ncbi:NAD(P)-binding protein [Aspergillus ellipticus CBS 707.79]|uniref:NAD(P)-binding protein n=1 Tax=Aspergillus ellipticus CBS 707.79 TaxID=1448320 RepID=A0A319CV01_9EURO|nr:NAD(P)-binding protein [Aspergillus ellipticus CBS 707.79]
MATFDITPEKQASIPRFFYHQLTFKPALVHDVSLQGQTAIVTGSNTGIGFETSRQLLDLGLSKLILAVRDEAKGNAAREQLLSSQATDETTTTTANIEVWPLDLSEYASVQAFAERCASLPHLHLVVLNAGIAPATRVFNAQTGHDQIVQVNYLSTALLAILLVPVLQAKRDSQGGVSRMTIVSSEVAAWTDFRERHRPPPLLKALDDNDAKVDMLDRMMVSKLLGQMFLAELVRRVPASAVVINAVSPGSVHDSQFNREHDRTFSGAIAKIFMRRVAFTAAVGARLVADAAVRHGEETHGQFLSFQKVVPMAPMVYNTEGKKVAAQLWQETMAELSFAGVEDILSGVQK